MRRDLYNVLAGVGIWRGKIGNDCFIQFCLRLGIDDLSEPGTRVLELTTHLAQRTRYLDRAGSGETHDPYTAAARRRRNGDDGFFCVEMWRRRGL